MVWSSSTFEGTAREIMRVQLNARTHPDGCLQGNATSGYTLSNAHNGKAVSATAPKPTPVVHELGTADGMKIDLATVTVEEIHIVPGGC
jgi:hypothetical protein